MIHYIGSCYIGDSTKNKYTYIYIYRDIPVVPARGGVEVAYRVIL